jgi:SNF2 family DNA or RNA helicase
VADEVQYAATPELRLTELLKAVPSEFRVAATATPIENDLDELFSIMEFVHPGILGNHDAFKKDYTVRDDFDAPRAYRLQLVRNELRQRISPFVFSGTKEELLPELPPLVEKRIELTMTPDQQKMYESVMTETEEFKEVLAREGLCVEPINTISKLIYLREIANDPITFDSHYNSDSAKFQAILEILMEAEENVLIFSGFKRMAMRIYNDISYWNHSGLANKWGLLYMDGNHTDSARETTVNIFNTRKPMILVATDCLKEGVNLPTARTVIHVDTAYNPATYQQRNGRAHRIGSTGQITVYSFVTVNTVEERIEVLVRAKKNLSDTVFGDEPNAISQKLTKNEIDWLVYGDEQSKTQSNNTVQNKKR